MQIIRLRKGLFIYHQGAIKSVLSLCHTGMSLLSVCYFYEFAQSIDCAAHSIEFHRLGHNL